MSVRRSSGRAVLSLTRALSTEDVLASTDVKGFPIVASKSSKALSGYIGRTELRYVLGVFLLHTDLISGTHSILDKAQHMGDVSPETPCSFSRQASDQEDFVLSGVTSGSALGAEEDVAVELLETTSSNDVLKLWPWVNQVRSLYSACYIIDLRVTRDTSHRVCTVAPRDRNAAF